MASRTDRNRLTQTLFCLCVTALLSGCVVPVPIATDTPSRSFVVGYQYPDLPDPGVEPATSRCTPPAGAAKLAGAVIAQVNQQRKSRGLATLRPSGVLARAAQRHACDNAARSSYSHTGSDGSDLSTRLRRAGYKIRVATENTAIGFDEPGRLVNFWMNSPGHRANILNPNTTEIGVGLAAGARPAWVLNMARGR